VKKLFGSFAERQLYEYLSRFDERVSSMKGPVPKREEDLRDRYFG